MIHKLKTHPIFFDDIAVGAKCFDIRKNDRNYQVGDILHLLEYIPATKKFTGDSVMVVVNYTISLYGIPEMPKGFIGMGIEVIQEEQDIYYEGEMNE